MSQGYTTDLDYDTIKTVKPCPFCGKEGIRLHVRHDMAVAVRCTSCGALGPSWSTDAEVAIEYWNVRK